MMAKQPTETPESPPEDDNVESSNSIATIWHKSSARLHKILHWAAAEAKEFYTFNKGFFMSLFESTESAWGQVDLLPENLRFALKHKGCQFGVSEVQTVIKSPWNGSGVYLLLKYLDSYPDLQQEVMKQIFDSIYETKDFIESREYMSHFLESLPPKFKEHTINGTKISQLCRQGWIMERDLGNAIDDIPENRTIFVVAYAGLLGIRPILQRMNPGDRFVVFLDKAPEPEKFCGYKVILDNTGRFSTEAIKISQLKDEKITLVDDTYNTGQTVEKLAETLRGILLLFLQQHVVKILPWILLSFLEPVVT